jgi:transcriptional regulator with XRE-family HTH domain
MISSILLTGTNMDKNNPEMSDTSGWRLMQARRLKRLRLKQLAEALKVETSTIQKWQNRGIPAKALSAVANIFGVAEWIFLDKDLTEKNFCKIILDPHLQDKFKCGNSSKFNKIRDQLKEDKKKFAEVYEELIKISNPRKSSKKK